MGLAAPHVFRKGGGGLRSCAMFTSYWQGGWAQVGPVTGKARGTGVGTCRRQSQGAGGPGGQGCGGGSRSWTRAHKEAAKPQGWERRLKREGRSTTQRGGAGGRAQSELSQCNNQRSTKENSSPAPPSLPLPPKASTPSSSPAPLLTLLTLQTHKP